MQIAVAVFTLGEARKLVTEATGLSRGQKGFNDAFKRMFQPHTGRCGGYVEMDIDSRAPTADVMLDDRKRVGIDVT